VAVECPVRDLSHLSACVRAEAVLDVLSDLMRARYDLSRAPLFRATLLRWGERHHTLLWACHHLVCDGITFPQFLGEVAVACAGPASGDRRTAPPPASYAELATGQDRRARAGRLQEHRDYWRLQLREPLPEMALPRDRERPARPTFETGRFAW